MRRFVPLILVLLLLSGGALAFSGQGTRLDPASLPEGWVVTGDWLASPGDLAVFSERLGVQVELLRNYVLKAPQGTIQVNLVLTATEEEAEDLYELFLSFHSPEEVARQGRRVVEMVTQQPGLLEPARAALRFLPEEVDPAKGAALKEYLARWSWPVMDWGDLTARLSQELGRYRLFLVGESHGTAFNQELEGALLEFFVREGGVRWLLLELPPSIAGFLQKYLETGDEELLKLAFAETRHTYFYTQERYNLWRRLRALQESLPEGERLHLVGLDVEQQPILALRYLQHLLDQVERGSLSETGFSQIQQVLRGEVSYPDLFAAAEFVWGLLLELEEEQVQRELGDLTFRFELVLSSLLAGLRLKTMEDPLEYYAYRDRTMYSNFLKQVPLGGGTAFFGQWGLNHVFQGPQLGVEWLAARINSRDEFAGTVCSLVLVYADSQRLSQDGTAVELLSTYASGMQILAELAGGKPLLVRLDGEGSPFSQELIWELATPQPASGVTTDYFQYLLYVPGAQAAQPLNW